MMSEANPSLAAGRWPLAASIKSFLESVYLKYNRREYIGSDPIVFPHTEAGDTEFIAFTSALFAYGNVKAMSRFLSSFFKLCGTRPENLRESDIKYRFQSAKDVTEYLRVIRGVYGDFGSVEKLFGEAKTGDPYKAGEYALKLIKREYLGAKPSQGLNFLFAVPGKSASKRLVMFLRWMVRRDEVDMGLWTLFDKKDLLVPLDTHIHRLCVRLKVIKESDKGIGAAKTAHSFFKTLSPEDPAKYDFALTRLGIVKGCRYERCAPCDKCSEREGCIF